MSIQRLVSILLLFLVCGVAAAESGYTPSKVVYDVSTADAGELNSLLDRASLLQIMYGNDPFDTSIVLVVHEGAIPLFAGADDDSGQLMQRAQSLTAAEIIQFRLCRVSARLQGFTERDFPGFVTVVPMADAEIVQLQREGYAYLR
ncbi:MAG: hypothetical protein GY783_00675 [Gammaproteobacteria bacterium]|nr:hypothetical protein [Gammaproteobacteria bacterium]MCP4875696.1 hypothetical protein [Gammaproteobacteria bacterium]